MIDFGIKGRSHNFGEFNNGEHLMNFNTNYHFADFDENDKTTKMKPKQTTFFQGFLQKNYSRRFWK